jgi:hypothetical protein
MSSNFFVVIPVNNDYDNHDLTFPKTLLEMVEYQERNDKPIFELYGDLNDLVILEVLDLPEHLFDVEDGISKDDLDGFILTPDYEEDGKATCVIIDGLFNYDKISIQNFLSNIKSSNKVIEFDVSLKNDETYIDKIADFEVFLSNHCL